jgi:ferric-dicitrate binding protein FerR (iron transport regulator)
MTCAELGEDLVALALGQLAPAEATQAGTHLAGCAACRAELAAARRVFDRARAAPLPEPSAGAEERLLAAFRADRAAPAPPTPARRPSRILLMFVPLAAAAAVLVAILATDGVRPARVVDGEGLLHPAASAQSAPGEVIRGSFAFEAGDEIEAGRTPFTARLSLAPGAAPAGALPAGSLELRLAPGARIARLPSGDVRLVAGTVDVAAGPLAAPFSVHAPPGRATIRGTRFTAATAEGRLVVVVAEGSVELSREAGPTEELGAGEEGLVDAERLLRRAADGRRGGDGFLTPRVTLAAGAGGRPQVLAVSMRPGACGAVTILPFDDSEPRFLLRLTGDDGQVRDVKIQRGMLAGEPPGDGARTWRLTEASPYEIAIDASTLGLAPGRYEAGLRYIAYRARSDGAEWLGVAESDSVPFEVPPK